MKRIFVPTQSASDWQRLLAKPELHRKSGASAMTAASSWESAAGQLPAEISELLNSTDLAPLSGLQLLVAIPEWQVELPGGQTRSATDVLALCRNDMGLCAVAVEAKVLEGFGPTLAEKRAKASEGQGERLRFLHELLGVEHFSDAIRYQLLHRTASAILTARSFHAATAVMLVHAFDTPADRMDDLRAFASEVGATEVIANVFRVARFDAPALFLVWCAGNPIHRRASIASAV